MSVPQKIRCEITRIFDHGGKVYSLELAPERKAPQFLPGQFLHLAIDPYEAGDFWPESRVFSIASTPTRLDLVTVTYSVVGKFTTKMEQQLKVGSQVWVKFPYGDFVIQKSGNVVLIAGGTGITAFTAFLEGLSETTDQQVTLFYGARNRDLLIFRTMLERKIMEVKNLSVCYFIEEGDEDNLTNILVGRISIDSILSRIDPVSNPVFYLSGPPGMLQSMTADLKLHGILENQIKTDAWE